VGKSTLLNHLIGQKISITSRKAQTTRHRVSGIRTTATAQSIFVDTPGLQRRHVSRLNARMNRTARDALAGVDAIVVVLEAGRTTEIDYLNGAIVRLAERHGIPAPANRAAAALIKQVTPRT
jgi:GTP-binding protein Era